MSTTTRTNRRPTILECPFTVAIDTREQNPWTFTGFTSDASQGSKPLVIHTEAATLQSGDYSIRGLESEVAIERKSLADLYGTVSEHLRHRSEFGRNVPSRFERELIRLSRMRFAAMVIEAGWSAICLNPPPHTRLTGKTVYRVLISWMVRYGILIVCCETRGFAERTCFRLLDRFWQDLQEERQTEAYVHNLHLKP
jgi:hypothetical protein